MYACTTRNLSVAAIELLAIQNRDNNKVSLVMKVCVIVCRDEVGGGVSCWVCGLTNCSTPTNADFVSLTLVQVVKEIP